MAIFNGDARTFVLGLDGFPYSLLKDQFNKGFFPHLQELTSGNNFRKMVSVFPTVSSVAWTSYSTGLGPAGHNIFGFVDRTANPFSVKIPTARDMKAKSMWRVLSEEGRRVIVINVPLTYPPEEVNGILISGFLCPDIEKSSYPQDISTFLKSRDYCIDVDVWLARESKEKFMTQLHDAIEKRFEIALELMGSEEWDFFQLHIMETDRLFHFFWEDIENKGGCSGEVASFFKKIDSYIGKIKERLSRKDRFLILSDHGFCGIKKEVQLNLWLAEQRLLKFENNTERKLVNYEKDSFCYSLIPGRIFINLQGREEKGSVGIKDYEEVRRDIKERLLSFQDPQNRAKVIDKVFFREEIYEGDYLKDAADIIAHPARGYDLKAKIEGNDIFDCSALKGMHTYDDAFILGVNFDLDPAASIQDIKKIILR